MVEHWVQPYEASMWVRILSFFGSEFPSAGSSEEDWHAFVNSSHRLPALLLVIGVTAAILTPVMLMCWNAPARSLKGQPPWLCLAMVEVVTVLLLIICVSISVHTRDYRFDVAVRELRDAQVDVWKSEQLADVLNTSGVRVVHDLDLLYTRCSVDAQDFMGNSVTGLKSHVDGFLQEARSYRRILHGADEKLDLAEEHAILLGSNFAWLLNLPLIIGIVCAAVVAGPVVVTEYAGPRCTRRCEFCQLPMLSLMLITPSIVIISAIAGSKLILGIQTSAFCRDADATTLRYAREEFGGRDSNGFNMTRYYIAGEGSNPALEVLGSAQTALNVCESWMGKYEEIISKTCPLWQPWNITLNLQAVVVSLKETQALLAPARIYPRYDLAVHELLCGSVVSGVSWVVILQALLALVCLPALVFSARCVQQGLMVEREGRGLIGKRHEFEPLAQDEDVLAQDEDALD